MLGLHPKTVIRLFCRSEIAAFRPGGKVWRTSREVVDEYIRTQLLRAQMDCQNWTAHKPGALPKPTRSQTGPESHG